MIDYHKDKRYDHMNDYFLGYQRLGKGHASHWCLVYQDMTINSLGLCSINFVVFQRDYNKPITHFTMIRNWEGYI